MTTVVITRPQGDEKVLAEALLSRGYRVIHEPLTEIVLMHTQRQALENALMNDPDAVILTSRRGAQALALLTDLRDLFLVCVGEATAKEADALGFNRISIAGGNVRALAQYLLDCYDEASCFLYVSGAHVSADLTLLLEEKNMRVERIPIYEAVPAITLSDTLTEQLRRGRIDAITFMSPRAAQIFTTLLKQAKIPDAVSQMQAFCLSSNVAEQLLTSPWGGIHVTEEATLASLLDCMDNAL